MSTSIHSWLRRFGAVLLGLVVVASSRPVMAVTTFLHHLDVGDPLNGGAGPADYAVGNPNQLIGPPNGPGGKIVPGGKFGNALTHSVGGRSEYETEGNFNVDIGTIEMWIKGPGVTALDFKGLWGTDTSSGLGDIRMYIYNDQVNDNIRSLGAYQNGAGGTHWEIEQPIPDGHYDDTNWHHVVWEYNTLPGEEVTALWWDGILLANVADSGTVINPRTTFSATRMHIGEVQAGSAPWPGLIDEFRISNHLVYDPNHGFTPPKAPFSSPAIAGDLNGDHAVDASDAGTMFGVWGTNDAAADLTHDGIVDAADAGVMFGNWTGDAAPQSVPEPNAFGSLWLVLGLGYGRFRRLGW